ncbi:pentatricopeptide repeat-containing protein At3g04760, chloroplastic-like [Chenopodium quinoa]|uniref:pentatricopeptide repeat-containing protein At3g04760, chloroplastic-like n=1 Tax=Chenopodium quinoa TaxID=63459 RepID=UPI000B783ADB|nr:pentatricopeptide repeat-containing protein At3g04760, chloroplastic-like [Chenopodium quinoa]
MDEIEVAVKNFTDNRKSTLFDEYERLSVEIQLNQAMLRRSLSEPGTSMFRAHLGVGAPPLVQQPVEQGKRGTSWGYGLHKIVKKLLRPVFWKKKGRKNDHHHVEKEQQEPSRSNNNNDLKSWKRFSKSVSYTFRIQSYSSASNSSTLSLTEMKGEYQENNSSKAKVKQLADEIRATPPQERSKILDSMIEKQGESKTIGYINDLLMGLVMAEELDLALKLFDEMPLHGLSPDCWTYSILIRCYCKKNLPDEGKRVLDCMIENGFRPNVVTLTILVNSLCSRGRLQRAFQVLEMMGELGCNPNVQTYNCVLKGLCFVGRVEEAYDMSGEAMELLEEAIAMGLTPGVVTYNALFNGYCKEGKPRKGVGLLKLMKDRGCVPDYISYSTLLHGLLKWGKFMAAYWVYKEMVEVGFKVDGRMMNTLLRVLCRKSWNEQDLFKFVDEVYAKMKSWDYSVFPDTYYLVIQTFCIRNEVDMALITLKEMIEAGYFPRMVTINRIIRGLCKEGKVSQALSILVLVCETGKFPSKISFNILIDEFNRQGFVLGACNVYGAALKLGIIPHRIPSSSQQIR